MNKYFVTFSPLNRWIACGVHETNMALVGTLDGLILNSHVWMMKSRQALHYRPGCDAVMIVRFNCILGPKSLGSLPTRTIVTPWATDSGKRLGEHKLWCSFRKISNPSSLILFGRVYSTSRCIPSEEACFHMDYFLVSKNFKVYWFHKPMTKQIGISIIYNY